MQLHYKTLGEGHPLIILHGLFGSLDNWLTIAKTLAEDYKVYLVDQRNHGDSPHSDDFNYQAMADDLAEFISAHHLENPYLIGHSMGGKAAMQFAVDHADVWEKLVVVDIAPKAYPVHHDTILEGLSSIDLGQLKSRGDADKQLARYVDEVGIRQFLLKNLARTADAFKWKINLTAIKENIDIIGEGLSWHNPVDKQVLFIRGENSNYISDDDLESIQEIFPAAELATVKNAGHWVHAEQPQILLDMITNFLKN